MEVKKKLEEQDHDILQFVITELRKRFNSVSKTIYCSIPIDNVWNNSKLLIPKMEIKKVNRSFFEKCEIHAIRKKEAGVDFKGKKRKKLCTS